MVEKVTDDFLRESAASASAAAIIVTDRGRYLMQLREDLPHVSYGGWWGLFGGAIEIGETPEDALRRELLEEINLTVDSVTYLTQIAWDMRRVGLGIRQRFYFVVQGMEEVLCSLPVLEGAAKAFMTLDNLLSTPKVIPPDVFAIVLREREEG